MTSPGSSREALVRDVTKRFGAITALDHVDLRFRSGSVHGLIGQNGAGKSTLIKVLAGLVRPDAGRLEVDGVAVGFGRTATAAGWHVSTAFQELTLVPHLSVAENLVLGRERAYGVRSYESGVRAATAILRRWHVEDIDPRQTVKDTSLPVQQRIEIARALERTERALVLDEPTSALDPSGADWLKERIREQRERGISIIIVSHRLAEIEDVCDEISVLRDGRCVASLPRQGLDAAKIATLMLGHEQQEAQTEPTERHASSRSGASVALSVRELTAPPILQEISLDLHEGEILGVAGLEGQGQHELFMTVFGARQPAGGSMTLGGRPLRPRSPHAAIAAGLGLVPEDRKTEGLMLQRSIRENIALPALRRASVAGFVASRREREAATPAMKSLGLATRTLHNLANSLSGGNQQKAVAAKWLYSGARVLLMYDPLRGVDVGARQEFFAWMTEFAANDGSVLFYSSDIDELTAVCDRIMTIYRGRQTSLLERTEVTRGRVLAGMLGEDLR
ncbi:sugar ABC transporter ATP-binding protein [Streptosporangium sp. NBC_01756]|uniref:sugar ABC transporter ATP-binding protein n=1 Tax=Streptosporangium sp. NBC_01756 TaxID=2975950 RepID=UPI002DDBC214|nr:sugar ABC transporter ATP-binding protein [Streptosporangium sp. NBC_01756]WSC85701.1 sugar ABC transporter ATP-binding protein [Streptosporangium sp. NBC_01756]